MTQLTTFSPTLAPASIVLENISWGLYRQLIDASPARSVHFNYDSGSLEIMTISPFHEKVKTVIARLIEAYCDELEIDLEGFGSTTFARETLKKGLEPDECYYVKNVALVASKRELDLEIDPPPDLAIEVDISPTRVARQPIYAALGVPEVWRFDGRSLASLHRSGRGSYREAKGSLAFPDLPMDQMNRFLAIGLKSGQSAAVRALRKWLRGQRTT